MPTKTRLTQLAICLCMFSCGEAAKPQTTPTKESKADPKKPEPAGQNPKVVVPPMPPNPASDLSGPVKIEPAMASHNREFYATGSWAKDGSEFHYCGSTEAAATRVNCGYQSLSGPSIEDLTAHIPPMGEDDEEVVKAMEKRDTEKDFSPDHSAKTWAYGAELELVWEKSETSKQLTVRVGARVRGETATDYVAKYEHEKLENGKEIGETIHPDVLALSPDGASLGVVSHYFGGPICTACGSDSDEDAEECKGCGVGDSYDMEILKVSEMASRAYNSAGLAYHKKGDYKKSAAFFQKSLLAEPTYKWAPYNLACALALSGEPGVEGALKKAVELGGAEFKAKASKDKDFDKVRAEPWFAAAIK